MECKKVEKLLSDYTDKSLRADILLEVEKHLAECPNCANYLNAMNKLNGLIKLKVKEKPAEGYFENYRARLESRLKGHTGKEGIILRRLFNGRRRADIFIPRFSSAFSAVLILLMIFVNSLLYVQIRQIASIQSVLSERQYAIQKEMSRYLTKTDKKVILQNLNSIDNNDF